MRLFGCHLREATIKERYAPPHIDEGLTLGQIRQDILFLLERVDLLRRSHDQACAQRDEWIAKYEAARTSALGHLVRRCIELGDSLGGLVTVEFGCDEPGWDAAIRWDDGEECHSIIGAAPQNDNRPEAALEAVLAKAKEDLDGRTAR